PIHSRRPSLTTLLSLHDALPIYFSNTLDLNSRTLLTLSGRFDTSKIRLRDRSGETPELNGNHRFERFNPALGISHALTPSVTLLDRKSTRLNSSHVKSSYAVFCL